MATPSNSFYETKQEFMDSLDAVLLKLTSIWDDIGIMGEACTMRKRAVIVHLSNLLEEMVREEEAMKRRVIDNIEQFRGDLKQLCRELGLPDYQPADGLTTLQLEKELRVRVETLGRERTDRLCRLKALSEVQQGLCDALCATPYYIPTGAVPTFDQLTELQQHIDKLEAEKLMRKTEFRASKRTILRLLSDLDLSPSSSFERDVVSDETEESFLLTSDNMRSLRNYHQHLEVRQKENVVTACRLRDQIQTLWDRLDQPHDQRADFLARNGDSRPMTLQTLQEELVRCKLLKIHNLRRFVELARADLHALWDKCYVSAEQRAAFKPFTTDEYTEQTLERHEQELARLQRLHESNKELYDRVSRREQLWTDFVEFERKVSDPNRLFLNRGCNLLKEEKHRNMLMKELPKVEQQVEEEIAEWERRTGEQFCMHGKKYSEYVRHQWDELRINKEAEKQMRMTQKAKKMEEEIKFGSKPVTPAVKRALPQATPTKNSNKLRKVAGAVGDSDGAPVPATPLTEANRVLLTGTGTGTGPAGTGVGAGTGDSEFSHTTVSSGEIQQCDPDLTLAPVVPYQDFALTLNENVRSNCRSSIMPKPSYY